MNPPTMSPHPLDKYQRLDDFLARLQGDVYPEPPSPFHTQVSRQMFERLCREMPPPAGGRVLDVGCGQGVALAMFEAAGLVATGIALGGDVDVCRVAGYDARAMNLSFLEFDDQTFDLVWCRHALEHSIFPLFSLVEMHRVLKPGGVLYVEVPAPETSCNHESNQNHYSVLGKRMWVELIRRAGFADTRTIVVNFQSGMGPDTYWAFTQRRPIRS
jgi:SAM-dependent methyltransferase